MKAWHILILVALLALVGCGEKGGLFSNHERETEVKKTEQSKARGLLDTKTDASYPAPTSYNITATGNATVLIGVPEKPGTVKLKQTTRKEAQEESDSSFSFDETIKSVSVLGWLFIALAFAVFVGAWIAWTKFTAAGKAADAAVASGINQVQKGLTRATSILEDSKPGGGRHKAARRHRDELTLELSELKGEENKQRSFFKPHTWK